MITALLLCVAPQIEYPAPPLEEGWTRLNGPGITANDRLVTLLEVQQDFERARSMVTVTTEEERLELYGIVLGQRIDAELASQAGEDMGVDRTFIQQGVESILSRRVSLDGLIRRAEENRDRGRDRRSEEEQVEDAIHRRNIEFSHQGKDAGARGRLWVDRFVRPGELYAAYEVNRDQLGEPTEVRLLDLVILEEATGDLAIAQDFVGEFRDQVLAGDAEMADLVRQYSAVREVSARLQLPLGATGAVLDPWLATAEVGDVSPVVPAYDPVNPGPAVGYRFVQVAERVQGTPAPPFVDRDVQAFLRRMLLKRRDDSSKGQLYARLRAEAHVWTSL